MDKDISDLMNLTQHLNCNDQALDLETDIDQGNKIQQITLAGKLISAKSFSSMVVKAVLEKAWNIKAGFKVSTKGNNLFVFSFVHSKDAMFVFQNRPWSLNNNLIVIRDWPADLAFEDLSFNLSPFWVQVYGLPPNKMTPSNAQTVGNFLFPWRFHGAR